MASVRTRRQARQEVVEVVEEESPRANGAIHSGATTRPLPKENIFLFIPNVIGYVRIVLAVGSLYYMPLHPRTCSLLYSISCLLDAVDGIAARRFEQSTRFGAVLDMVTDRCTTSCLLVFLSAAFPRWSIIFQGLISLDLASHYLHMYATLTMAGQGQSHKEVDINRVGWRLHKYYTNKTILFTLCALNEIFFIAVYLLSFSSPAHMPMLVQTVQSDAGPDIVGQSAQPGNPAVPYLSELQDWFDKISPSSAAAREIARANKIDSTIPLYLARISAPFMLAKNWLNIEQMLAASRWLAEGDIEERRAKGLPRKKRQ